MGLRMPGWYDIVNFDDLAQKSADEPGILRSQRTLHALVDAERHDKGIAADRIVLGGFSQGAAMAIVAGLTYPATLGGIFAMSGYLLLPGKLRELVPKEDWNRETSVWMAHGERDPLVRFEWGRVTAERLREWGYRNVEFRGYPGLDHSADPKEIDDLESWLRERLPEEEGESGSGGGS
ncbi:MAG: hypothetical protein M1816_007379 [Peltula sp. TS41687]|nr:MAG: hypothetical protein M1816_007379 [Peltula sp. TS41687]